MITIAGLRRSVLAGAVALGTLGTIGVTGQLAAAPAGAAPGGSLSARAAALTLRLESLGRQESRVDEQYDRARIALTAAEVAQQDAAATAARAAAAVVDRRHVLTAVAVDAYMHGGSIGAVQMMIESAQRDFGVRQTYLQTVADTEQSAVDGLGRAQSRYAADQAQLAGDVRAARAEVNRIAAMRDQLAVTAAAERGVLSQVHGQLAGLVTMDQSAARGVDSASTISGRTDPPSGPSGGGGPVTTDPGAGSQIRATALQWARRELGKPYVWGAAGPDSFNCSGFITYIFGRAGASLPHSAAGQWDDTTRISYSQLQPGDLIFYYQPVDHVGIYVGNGQMIDAPHTGSTVEYDPIWWNYLDGFGRVS